MIVSSFLYSQIVDELSRFSKNSSSDKCDHVLDEFKKLLPIIKSGKYILEYFPEINTSFNKMSKININLYEHTKL